MSQANTTGQRPYRGFTLVELMVAIALISVLAGIAIPFYQGYIREGHFVSIRTTINGMRTPIEDYRLENGNYGATATLTDYAQISTAHGGRFDWEPSGDAAPYTFSVVVVSTNSYDVYGTLNANAAIWARCDDRFLNCCDAETTGSASLIACP